MNRNDKVTITLEAWKWSAIANRLGSQYAKDIKTAAIAKTKTFGSTIDEICDRGLYDCFQVSLCDQFGIDALEPDAPFDFKFEPEKVNTSERAKAWSEQNPDALVRLSGCSAGRACEFCYDWRLESYEVLTGVNGTTPVWTPLTEIPYEE